MRLALILCLAVLAACRAPYSNEIADLTVMPDELPPYGTPADELDLWFDAEGYRPGPRIYEAESDLRRLPGTPVSYTSEQDRSWWLSRVRTVRDFCVTEKYVYYRLDADQKLARAIMTSRSHC